MTIPALNSPFRILIALGGVALLLSLLASKSMAAQVLLALLLVFILPGYAITMALLPRGEWGMVERLLLAIGASLATSILGGLVLHQTPWGLQASSWIVLLTATTLAASAVAWVRKEQQPPTTRSKLPMRVTPQQGLLLALAVVVAGVALNVNDRPAPRHGFQGYTLLWMLPAEAGEQPIVRLGLNSKEFSATTYSLQVKVDGEVAHEWRSIELRPNEQWEERIELSQEQLTASTVEALLYRLDSPGSIYRHVLLRHDKGEE
ncbi:MAG: hypothetical protein DCC55_16480 [Chloroflexi bacterium]|nr:MAG: hypothetical protein DCC55_16480 [Chloroflexota bacterium]